MPMCVGPYELTDEQVQIAENNGINYRSLYHRIYTLGWSVQDAITVPLRFREKESYNKLTPEQKDLMKKNGLKWGQVWQRIYNGWDVDRAVSEVIGQHRKTKYPAWVFEEMKKNNVPRSSFYYRVNNLGWSIRKACTTPPETKRRPS